MEDGVARAQPKVHRKHFEIAGAPDKSDRVSIVARVRVGQSQRKSGQPDVTLIECEGGREGGHHLFKGGMLHTSVGHELASAAYSDNLVGA